MRVSCKAAGSPPRGKRPPGVLEQRGHQIYLPEALRIISMPHAHPSKSGLYRDCISSSRPPGHHPAGSPCTAPPPPPPKIETNSAFTPPFRSPAPHGRRAPPPTHHREKTPDSGPRLTGQSLGVGGQHCHPGADTTTPLAIISRRKQTTDATFKTLLLRSVCTSCTTTIPMFPQTPPFPPRLYHYFCIPRKLCRPPTGPKNSKRQERTEE